MNSRLPEPSLPSQMTENQGLDKLTQIGSVRNSCGFNRQNPEPDFTWF
ncbi:hypothetical protein H6G89_04985 [Oscillatoria sp. FACHB-1407]|nr:hypothetical protein [Oscillatoria sp. FACHB-1407]MBD2460393.1 hypothetical protein [Oscillatoria sp. FACHB-1407]